MKVRTQIRPNGEPGVSELHWGLKEMATGLLSLIAILLSIGAAWVAMSNRLAALEMNLQDIDRRAANLEMLREHIIRNTEWIDAERRHEAAKR